MSAEPAESIDMDLDGLSQQIKIRKSKILSEIDRIKQRMEKDHERAETAEKDHRALANIIETMRRDDWKNTTEDFKHRSQSDSGLVKELRNASVDDLEEIDPKEGGIMITNAKDMEQDGAGALMQNVEVQTASASQAKMNSPVLSQIASSTSNIKAQSNVKDAVGSRFSEAPMLAFVLRSIGHEDLLDTLLGYGINDFWIPLSKQTLRRILQNRDLEMSFLHSQAEVIATRWHDDHNLQHPHVAFEDGDEVVKSQRILGEGGFSIVDEVILPTQPKETVCVRKRLQRTKQFKAQRQIMEAFSREIRVMERVVHPHCVQFLGSYTDEDTLAIFSLPVADMDLASFLDQPKLSIIEEETIRRGIGCLSNALLYLHEQKIRHEELKPQNVLIHGRNMLLTDFGFSLDFSEDSVSTTIGRPSHWTARYSAPESLNHEPRNRATDIWALGCILTEMLSALYGHRLSELTTFWKKTGDGHPSYSINKNAVARWQEKLFTYFVENYQHAILFTFILSMLEDDRNARPTAQQIVDKLHDLDRLFPEHESHIGECCQKSVYVSDHIQHFSIDSHPAGYYYPGACGNYTFVLADLGLNTLACDAGNAFPFNTPLHHPSELIIDCEKIRNTCEDLINRAPNTPFFRPQFVPGNQKQLRGQMGAVDLVRRRIADFPIVTIFIAACKYMPDADMFSPV